MALSAFPPELILDIVWHLPRKDCLNLARCSHYLCDVARHSLFRTVRLDWRTELPGAYKANSDLVRFVRLVIEQPSVASSVREIVAFEGERSSSITAEELEYATHTTMTQLDIENHLKAIKALYMTNVSDGEAFVTDLRALVQAAVVLGIPPRMVLAGGFAGLLVLLFYHLPNLTDLHLSLVCPSYPFLQQAIGGHLTPDGSLPQAFNSLQKLVFGRTHSFHSTSLCNCWPQGLPFLKLPSLQRVELGELIDATSWPAIPTYLDQHSQSLLGHRSPIKYLLIHNCRLSSHTLRLISSTCALTSLRISSTNSGPATMGLEKGDSFSSLISAQNESLRRLYIPNWNQSYMDRSHVDYLGTLRPLSLLNELHIECRLLLIQLDEFSAVGFPIHHILPPSLAHLSLFLGRHPPWDLRGFINKTQMPGSWSQEKQYFPSLRSFWVKGDKPWGGRGLDLVEALKGFQAMAIEVVPHD